MEENQGAPISYRYGTIPHESSEVKADQLTLEDVLLIVAECFLLVLTGALWKCRC